MLSLPKLLLTLVVIAAVFYLGRSLTRRADSLMRKPPEEKKPQAVELDKCAVCETYVGPDSPACGRADCPQPR